MPKVKTTLTPFTPNFTTEVGEYYGLAADKDIREMLGDPRAKLLFTENQIKVAYERWVREGKPEFVDEASLLTAMLKFKNAKLRRLQRKLRCIPRPRKGWGWLWRMITVSGETTSLGSRLR